MALERFDEGDQKLGQPIAQGNRKAFLPAVMLADSAGNELPSGGAAIAGTSGNVANGSAAAALAAVAAKTNYATAVEFTFSGATGASVVVATVTGLLGGTQSFIVSVPAGVTVGGTPLCIKFDPPHPASAVNTAITATLPALGAGNTNACANIRGIQK